jgi:hypothetical protein
VGTESAAERTRGAGKLPNYYSTVTKFRITDYNSSKLDHADSSLLRRLARFRLRLSVEQRLGGLSRVCTVVLVERLLRFGARLLDRDRLRAHAVLFEAVYNPRSENQSLESSKGEKR